MGKFKLAEIEQIAKQVSKKASYPIADKNALAEAFGGKQAKIKYEGKDYSPEELDKIPPDTFPIASEKDFVNKMASLRGGRGDEPEELPRGKKLDKLPPDAGEPPKG